MPIGPWRVLGASVQGSSHQQSGQPCQDAHSWHVLPGGILVAAVADGAGSAPLSEIGARTAADAAVQATSLSITALGITALPKFEEQQGKKLLSSALEAARTAVEQAAAKENHPVADLASTLILVVAGPDFAAAAQVGDGAAVIEDNQEQILALTKPQRGEFVNETNFLTSAEYLSCAQIIVWEGRPQSLALFSDGLQLLALDMQPYQAHIPFFSPLFRFVKSSTDEAEAQEQLTSFLRSPRITGRADDDLTLLLAACGKLA